MAAADRSEERSFVAGFQRLCSRDGRGPHGRSASVGRPGIEPTEDNRSPVVARMHRSAVRRAADRRRENQSTPRRAKHQPSGSSSRSRCPLSGCDSSKGLRDSLGHGVPAFSSLTATFYGFIRQADGRPALSEGVGQAARLSPGGPGILPATAAVGSRRPGPGASPCRKGWS